MKTRLSLAGVLAAAIFAAQPSSLALTVDYANKGTDGALVITANRTIDLSQSATRAWDAPPEARGSGVYDPEKWAVVFKYSSVDIGPNATVTFNNHASRAPVVWLVDGDVTIHGTVSLNGQNQDTDQNLFRLTEPGPGGFRGGDRYVSASEPGAAGFGPGGSFFYRGSPSNWQGPSYGTFGPKSGSAIQISPAYGNGRVVPLIGGSGGAGYSSNPGQSGAAAGGGAILVVAQGIILVHGSVLSRGGNGSISGSGGAIRLIAQSIGGTGRLSAQGGDNATSGDGRIRLEADDFQGRFSTMVPTTQAVRPDSPVMIWAPAEAPTARVISVSGVAAPNDPRSSLGPPSNLPADVTLENGPGSGEILIETDNLPRTASVMLRLSPRYGEAQEVRAEFLEDTAVPNRFRWRVQKPLNLGYVALQVRATAQ